MNSPLDHDFVDGFGFTSDTDIPEEEQNTGLEILGALINQIVISIYHAGVGEHFGANMVIMKND